MTGSELAMHLADIRRIERETGVKYPRETEALIRQWERLRT